MFSTRGFTKTDYSDTLLGTRYALEHRVDGLNRSSRASRGEPSDLTSAGAILWRLSTTGQDDLWCFVFEHPENFYLVLDTGSLVRTPCPGSWPRWRCSVWAHGTWSTRLGRVDFVLMASIAGYELIIGLTEEPLVG